MTLTLSQVSQRPAVLSLLSPAGLVGKEGEVVAGDLARDIATGQVLYSNGKLL